MAIYKPSNFYPNLDEIDWRNPQTFECQVNTDGSTAKAYKIQILSTDGVALYENYGNFGDPVKNKEFASMEIEQFEITDINQEFVYESGDWIDETPLNTGISAGDKILVLFTAEADQTEIANYTKDTSLNYYYVEINNDTPADIGYLRTYDGEKYVQVTENVKNAELKETDIYCIKVLKKVNEEIDKYVHYINLPEFYEEVEQTENPPEDWSTKYDTYYKKENNIFVLNDSSTWSSSTQYYKKKDNKSKFLLSMDGKFISLTNNETWTIRKDYVPFNIYQIISKKSTQFCLYHETNEATISYPIIDYDKENFIITIDGSIDNIGQHDLIFIGLSNGFDYKWTVRLYQNLLLNQGEILQDTVAATGYITGTNNGVILYDNIEIDFNKDESEKNLTTKQLIDNYVKMDKYIEMRATSENSYIFKEQINNGFLMTATYSFNDNIFSTEETNLVDFEKYQDNLYVKITASKNSYNFDVNYFNFLFEEDPEDNSNYFCYSKVSLTNNLAGSFSLENPYMKLFFKSEESYAVQFYYCVREKIYDCSNNLGFNNNINQILLDKEFKEYLKNTNFYYLYTCNNNNTNSSFYGEPNGEIQVGRYVRFPELDETLYNEENFPSSITSETPKYSLGINVKSSYFERTSPSPGIYIGTPLYTANSSFGVNSKVNIEPVFNKTYTYHYTDSQSQPQEDTAGLRTSVRSEYFTQGIGAEIIVTDEEYNKFITYSRVPTTYDKNRIVGGKYHIIPCYNPLYGSSYRPSTNTDYFYCLEALSSSFAGKIDISSTSTNGQIVRWIVPADFPECSVKIINGVSFYYIWARFYDFAHSPAPTIYYRSDDSDSNPYIYSNLKSQVDNPSSADVFCTTLQLTTTNDHEKYYNDNNFRIVVPEDVANSLYDESQDYYYLHYQNRLLVDEADYNRHPEVFIASETNPVYYYLPIKLCHGPYSNQTPISYGEWIRNSGTSREIIVPEGTIGAQYRIINGDTFYYISTGINVNEQDYKPSSYFSNNQNRILYKIIGYDSNTGEVRLENNTYRSLTDTDIYEIWERYAESGESSVEYFTRKLPEAGYVNNYLKIGGIPKAKIPCLNSKLAQDEDDGEIFIQPNINFKTDEQLNPKIVFDNGKIADIIYNYDIDENRDFSQRDKSIDKLDNSQWIIKTNSRDFPVECGSLYTIYSDFIDSAPENYFYSRNQVELDVKYIENSMYNEADKNEYKSLGYELFFDTPIVKCLNCKFIGIYSDEATPVKRYCFKIYDKNGVLLYTTYDVYSSDISFNYDGLGNGLYYTLELEVENQLGYTYSYIKEFRVMYEFEETQATDFVVENDSDLNAVRLYFKKSLIDVYAQDYEEVRIYKRKIGETDEFVYSFNLSDPVVKMSYEEDGLLGCLDFNVENDTIYEYYFIYSIINKSLIDYTCDMAYKSLVKRNKTCFKGWQISDISINSSKNRYEINETWTLKYNLEDENITTNRSITKFETIGKYSQVAVGEKAYDSSSVSCLLGDIGKYIVIQENGTEIIKEGYNEYDSQNPYLNNKEKLKNWKRFCDGSNSKFLQDYKGNKWICHIYDNTEYRIAVNSQEQLTTISFNWSEVENSNNVQIIKEFVSDLPNINSEIEALLEKDWEMETDVINKKIVLKHMKSDSTNRNIELPSVDDWTYELHTGYVDLSRTVKSPFKTDIETITLDENISINVVYIDNEGDSHYSNCNYLFYNCSALTSVKTSSENSGLNILCGNCDSFVSTFDGCGLTINVGDLILSTNSQDVDIENIFGPVPEPIVNQNSLDMIYGTEEQNSIPERHVYIADVSENHPEFNYKLFRDLDVQYRDTWNVLIESQYIIDISSNNDFETISYSSGDLTLTNYRNSEKNIVLFSEKLKYNNNLITGIHLRNNNTLKTKNSLISSLVQSTADNAYNFEGWKIKLIFVSGSVGSIEQQAFYECTGLTSVTIPNSVTTIGENVFYGCSSLTSIEIPDTVASIGSGAFAWCSSLTSIEIPDTVTNIGSGTFSGCSSLTSIEIPDGITSIGPGAFNNCSSLTSIEIPNSVTNIGPSTFSGCSSLTSIEIPNSVTNIGNGVFSGCSNLISINVDSNNNDYSSKDGILFNKNKTNLMCYPEGKIEEHYVIPNSVTRIENESFYGCSSLTSVEIPNSVTSIGVEVFKGCSGLTEIIIPDSVTSIGNNAFSNIKDSAKIVINKINDFSNSNNWGVEASQILDIDDLLNFSVNNNEVVVQRKSNISRNYFISVTIPSTYNGYSVVMLGNTAFYDCSSLISITIPNSITDIGESVFEGCNSLVSITIPNSVTSIGKRAFYNCQNLIEINVNSDNLNYSSENGVLFNKNKSCLIRCPEGKINSYSVPSSVEVIYEEAFLYCNLTQIEFQETSTVQEIENSAFAECSSLTSIIIPNSVTSIKDNVFSECISLTSMIIPDSVTSMGKSVFDSCSGLTSITISNNVTSIGNYAFRDCINLTLVEIPSNVTSIGNSAFSGCCSLTSITIPNNVANIGNSICYGCSDLISITFSMSSVVSLGYLFGTNSYQDSYLANGYYIPNSLTTVVINGGISIKNSAFHGCYSLTSVTIPNNVENIENWAFYECSSLISITIPNSVTSIGISAFNRCTRLTSITIPNSVTSIGNNAFAYCENLTSITIGSSVTSIGSQAFYNTAYYNNNNNWENNVLYINNYLIAARALISGNYTLKSGTKIVADYAFLRCFLNSVTISNTVISIGNGAFSDCSQLTSVTFESPSSVTSIGSRAFYNTKYYNNNNNWENNVLYINNYLIAARYSISGNYTLKSGTKIVATSAFYNCTSLISVTIPNSVTSIGNFAFERCSGLTSIIIDNTEGQPTGAKWGAPDSTSVQWLR